VRSVVVIGLGEVGAPLLELVRRSGRPGIGIDVEPQDLPAPGTVDVMHVCFPFEIPDFVGEVARYAELLAPRLTIVNSTVAVGTTRAIHQRAGGPIAHSPVRGKHAHMLEQMASYAKFVGGVDATSARLAAEHFAALGLHTQVLSSPESTELAKLSETTYFGLLIAWAQEVERYCELAGADYEEVVSFYDEIPFLPPVRYFPGRIGGHCVMPNLEILNKLDESAFLDVIRLSNERKVARESGALA
jgi:UDP-N-acetyl-D-mannosaminuronate dehydrogenase